MEDLYLSEREEQLLKKPVFNIEKISLNKYKITTKKRGGLNEITDLRDRTAKLISKPIGQVMKLTKGWTEQELYTTLRSAESFNKNPPACWWCIYKQKKHIYGRNNKETLLKDRKKGRKENSSERQKVLF